MSAAAAVKEPLLPSNDPKGGFRTLPFIIVTDAFEKVATFGLMPNMILYLTREYGMENVQGANVLFMWSAATNFTPVLGAFLADSYVGRFRMIAFGSIFSLLGLVTLWLTAMIPQARPPPCKATNYNDCYKSATTPQLFLLYSSFALMSIGSGGVRSSSMAFGADQLVGFSGSSKQKSNSSSKGMLERYFSWYYMLVSVSVILALTCIVGIQETMGWQVGFGVPLVLMMFSTLSFFLASPFYVCSKPKSSLLTGLAQVFVASYHNRSRTVDEHDDRDFHCSGSTTRSVPTDNLRFLNKACTIQNREQDLTAEGEPKNPWQLCTVDQVEDLKSLIRVLPIWSTGMLMAINISQGSFQTIMADHMDRHVTSHLEIPAGSYGVFMIITLSLWVILYDRVIIPIGSKIRGKPTRLTIKQRMGSGILFSSLAMVALAIVESFRRHDGGTTMSAMWLMPYFVLLGLAEGLNATAQSEFYYNELPKSMSSIATSLWGMALSGASLASSLIVSAVDEVTAEDGSWTSSDIDKGHYDYFYWLLASISFGNFVYYLGCSKAYGDCVGRGDRVVGDDDFDGGGDGA
ncbi:Protein NRT1/ PTR FAMILY 1.2 [Linum perenne]